MFFFVLKRKEYYLRFFIFESTTSISMSSITVLCPNARRQQVKVEPNLKILQIIEEVCKKQGLNSDDYEIM